MEELAAKISESAKTITSQWSRQPKVGIVLGSGLGGFVEEMDIQTTIPYRSLPGFETSTAVGHAGELVCGLVGGRHVVAMNGRFHLYEGHAADRSAFPIRVMKHLGVDTLFVSNAAGGLNPNFKQGDIVLLDDQINLMFRNPLIGDNDDQLGPRFPDMCSPFDVSLGNAANEIGRRLGVQLQRGVYAAVLGPNYETRAEIRMLRTMGADVVGMSTVPEVLVAVHGGMRVLGLSVVTNVCRPDRHQPTSGDEVVNAAKAAEKKMRRIVVELIKNL